MFNYTDLVNGEHGCHTSTRQEGQSVVVVAQNHPRTRRAWRSRWHCIRSSHVLV